MVASSGETTKQQKITKLQNRIENLKKSLKDPESLTHVLYESKSPKKDHIRAWAETLEALHRLGAYPHPVHTISSHIRNELKNMGLERAVEWAKTSLPFKYKDPAMVHASRLLLDEYNQNRVSEKPEKFKSNEQIAKENQPYIQEIEKDIQLLQTFKSKLYSNELVSKLDKHELDQFFIAKRGLRKLIYSAMDGRDKVLPEKLHFLIHGYTEGSKNNAFRWYMKHVREVLEITSKQAVRLLSGRVTKVEDLYEPKNQKEARQVGFYGVQCMECGNWRVDKRYDSDATRDRLFCYRCKGWFEIKTEPLMLKTV